MEIRLQISLAVLVVLASKLMSKICIVDLSRLTTWRVGRVTCCSCLMTSSPLRNSAALTLHPSWKGAVCCWPVCRPYRQTAPQGGYKTRVHMCGADLDEPTVKALKLHKLFISSRVLRTLEASSSVVWFIFRDACFDLEAFSGVGAVLVSSDGKLQRYFAQEIDVGLLKMINVTSSKTAIFELGFFAIFCSIHVWGDLLKGAQLVACTYNDVRDSLIACQSSSVNCEPKLEACLKIEYELGLNLWMSRVPTDSRIADDPSRGHVELLESVGCCRQHLDVQLMWNALLEFSLGEALTCIFPSQKGAM